MEPTHGQGHEGGLSVRDQIERYRTAFIAVVTMVVIAAAVGGYILAHENLKLPGWVPVLRPRLLHPQGRVPDRPGGDPGAGPGGHDRRREDRRSGERRPARGHRHGDDESHPQVRAHLPQRDAAAAPEDPAAGHHGRGQPGHALRGQAEQRRSAAPLPDRPERQLRRIPGGAGRRNARLPAGAAGRGRAKASTTTAGPSSATLKRFDPAARYGQEIAARARHPPRQTSPARSTTSAC